MIFLEVTLTGYELAVQGFEDAEHSFQLEGLDPTEDPIYQDLKARILRGEITAEQAVKLAVESFTAKTVDYAGVSFLTA